VRDYLNISCSPADEDCAQVGQPNYEEQSKKECQAFKNQLLRQFGPPPGNARVAVKSFPHDFGYYREVVVYFDDNNEEECDYAFKLENKMPLNWDEEAQRELRK